MKGGQVIRLATVVAALGAAGALASAGCRPSPECYAADECLEAQMCVAGRCVANDGGVLGVLEPSWHEVIFPIIQQRCWGASCHQRPLSPGVPMALEQYADTQQPSRLGDPIYTRMAARVRDLQFPMPPRGQSQLDSQQIRFFIRWDELGAPLGDPTRAPDGGVIGSVPDAGVVNSGPLEGAGPYTEIAASYVDQGGTRASFFDLNGPAWGNAMGTLVMTDRAQDAVFAVTPPELPQIILRPSGEAVGVGADALGNLLLTQYASRRLVRVIANGFESVADTYMGSDLNGPHDVVSRANGHIYFTDPAFGLGVRVRDLNFNGIFRLPADGSPPVVEWQGLATSGPAGLELSPDEQLLYVADRVSGSVMRFPINVDSSLGPQSEFAVTYGSPDGVTVDVDGNVYVATSAGVQAFGPDGLSHGLLAMPEAATGLTFGGPDLRTLFVTSKTRLYSFPMVVAGVNR